MALAHRELFVDGSVHYCTQMIDYVSGKQSHVSRGVWSSELFNQCDMLDAAILLLGYFQELRFGPLSGAELRKLRENGGFALQLELLTDSLSIFSYLRSVHLKMPAERGTVFHLAYIRECLVNLIVSWFTWIDTRDMVADGLTKGSCDRAQLHEFMRGYFKLRHSASSHSHAG